VLRRKRKRALELLNGLTQSIFLEMFGSIDNLEERSDIFRLADVIADQRIGLVRSASELSRDPPGVPYLRMDAIGTDGSLDLAGAKFTRASAAEIASYSLRDGDLLFNTRNSRDLVGKTAVFYGAEQCIYNNNILRIRFNGAVTPEYMLSYFRTRAGQRELESRKAGTTSVFAIYQKSLVELPVAVPPVERQREFSRKVLGLAAQVLNFQRQSDSLDTLFSSLQHRAFTGQL
jgi:type I restriction enzyme S subunit